MNRSKGVSWIEAYQAGFSVAINHRIFTLITIFSVMCERSAVLFSHFTGISMKDVLRDYRDLFLSFSHDPFGGIEDLLPFKKLLAFMPVALGLFVLGVFVLVGVLGLMRDLLVKDGYRTKNIIIRGREYLWPIMKFKVPVYVALSLLLVAAASVISSYLHDDQYPVLMVSAVALFYGLIFALARIFLSLGPKMIVTREIRKVIGVYPRIMQIIRPAFRQVIVFYALLFVLMAVGLCVPVLLSQYVGVSFFTNIFSIILLAFLTVVIKAASFSMYLQLAGLC